METPQPTTSNQHKAHLSDDGREFEKYGKATYSILKNVFQELTVDERNTINEFKTTNENEIPMQRAQRYTGLHMKTLEILRDNKIIIKKLTIIDRKYIHNKLMSFYLDKNAMPTTTELFNSLQDVLPCYEDIRSFRKKLIKMGYIFKKKGNRFVVFEKPSIRFERFLYLKNIMQYRGTKRPIYFLSEAGMSNDKVWNIDESFLEKNECQNRFLFGVSSIKVEFLKRVDSFNTDNFNSWILNDLIPNLERHSVIVLDNSNHHCDVFCETPSKNSPAFEMINWLTFHNIPFNETMSRIELYTLIEKCTDTNKILYKPDIWLKQNGHDVLRLPNCINEMTPAAQVLHLIIKSINSKENLIKNHDDIISRISETDLNTYNSKLIEEEKNLYELELKLDNIIDKLDTTLNTETETDLYLLSLSDSDDSLSQYNSQ